VQSYFDKKGYGLANQTSYGGEKMARVIITFIDKDTRAPIAFLSCVIDGQITASDTSGKVAIDLPAGTYTLRVRHPFYEPVTQNITVPGTYSFELRSVHL